MVIKDGEQPTWLLNLHKILQYLPHAGIISSFAVIVALIFLNKYTLLPYALCLLIPVILVSLYFIWKRSTLPNNLHGLSSFCNKGFDFNQCIFIKIYCILFCGLVVWLLLTSSRNIVFLIAVFLLYGLSIFQIFLKKFNVKHIIIQLVLTTLLCALSQIYCYAFYYGGGDGMPLRLAAESILGIGYLDSTMLYGYGQFPLYHITLAIMNLVSSLPLYDVSWIGLDLFTIPLSLFIFLIAKKLTQSDRISALTLFFYLTTPFVFSYIGHIAPRTLSTIAFGIVLYLFLRSNAPKSAKFESGTMILLAGIFTVYMILAHHAQLILHFAVMTVLVISYLIYKKRLTSTQIGILVLFYGIPLLYYLYSYLKNLLGILTTNFFGSIFNHEITDTAEIMTEGFGISNVVLLSAGILILIGILFGLYYITHRVSLKSPVIFIWPLALLLFAIYIPNVADAFSMLAAMEQIGRLQIVLAPIFSIVIAIGCVVLGYSIYSFRKNSKAGKISMILFCLLVIVAAPIITSAHDSSFFDYTEIGSSTSSFNENEIYGLDFIKSAVTSGSGILCDYSAIRYFTSISAYTKLGVPYYTFPAGTLELFTVDGSSVGLNQVFIYRDDAYINYGFSITNKGGNNVGKETTSVKYDPDTYQLLRKNTYDTNRIYQGDGFETMIGNM